MIKEYNNKRYYFDDDISAYNFVRQSYILPIDIWKEVCLHIFKTWNDQFENSILKNMLNLSNENCNYFLYNDKKYWLDKARRSSILELLNSDIEEFSLVLEDCVIPMDLNKAKEFISDLTKYSYNCLLSYNRMKQNLNNYKNADFEYPEPLNLNNYL